MANARAYSVIDVILGEAGGKSKADRYQDMLNIASAIANRAAATGETPENIVSGKKQFHAYDKALPPGTPALHGLAEKAWNEVQTKGPVHSGTYFATSVAVDSLPRGLSRISDGVKGGHVIFADPKNRPIVTASGVRPIDPSALVAPSQETTQAEDAFSILSPDLSRPTGLAGPDSQSAREIAPGLGLGNLIGSQPTFPDMAGKAFGPAGGVDFSMGPKRPEMPNQGIVDIVRGAVDSVYGPDYKVEVISGKGSGHGSNRHPTGNAVDVRIYTPEGRMLDAKTDRDGMLAVAQAAQAKGALGTGLGTDYMGGVGMHIDAVQPGRNQDHEWGDIGNANKELLTRARENGQMPLPMRMAPPPSRPTEPAVPEMTARKDSGYAADGIPELARLAGIPEPNPARFEGTPAPMLGTPTGLPEPNPARFEGTPFPSPNRTGMQPFGGVPTPGLTPISLAWDPRGLGSIAPTPVQTSAFGLPPSGQAVPANNFGLAHGQLGFAGGVPAREVSALFKVDGPGPRDGAFTQDAYRNPQNFEFAPSPELAAPADARFSGPAAPKGDRLPSALPSREMFAMADAMQGAPAARPVALPGAMPDFAGVMAGKPISPGSTFGPQDVERAKANRPTDGVPYSGPGSYITPEAIERSRQEWIAGGFKTGLDAAAAPKGDRLLSALPNREMFAMADAMRAPSSGAVPLTPMMTAGQMRAPDLKSEPFGQVAPKSVPTTREVRAALPIAGGFAMPSRGLGQFVTAGASAPAMAGRAVANPSAASRREPVRIVNPISVGQAGGKYAGSGVSATSAVLSGSTPVGTVARSASNPSVSLVSLPGHAVAHINDEFGWTETFPGNDLGEPGFHRGTQLAISPDGKSFKNVSPGKAAALAAQGWSVYGTAKGTAKSTGPGKSAAATSRSGPSAGPAQRGGLMGMLSGLFGQQGPGIGRGGVLGALGLHGPIGTAAGLFGPAGGMGGLGLGGGFGGGPAGGGGFGGYGNPGFGGSISSNNNYGGL